MRLEFDDGTLLLRDASDDVSPAEWDDRVDEYRAQAHRYRALLEWAGVWTADDEQATLTDGVSQSLEDTVRAYPELALTPALHIEPRDYQQAALDAWVKQARRGSVVLPTGSGKTFLGLQAIADAGVGTLVVTPTIDLMNQWHATLSNAFGDQLRDDSPTIPDSIDYTWLDQGDLILHTITDVIDDQIAVPADAPCRDTIIEHAKVRDIDESTTRTALRRLEERGDITTREIDGETVVPTDECLHIFDHATHVTGIGGNACVARRRPLRQ